MTPDYFGELTAWRRFNLRSHGRVLVSVNHPVPWATADPGEAFCIRGDDRIWDESTHDEEEPCPAFSCGCGYYAFKDRSRALAHEQGKVLAQVKVWGRLIEHRYGYRAQRMRLEELYVPSTVQDVAPLVDRYNVPVLRLEDQPWISENRNVSSSSNLSQNPPWSPLWNLFQNVNLSALQSTPPIQPPLVGGTFTFWRRPPASTTPVVVPSVWDTLQKLQAEVHAKIDRAKREWPHFNKLTAAIVDELRRDTSLTLEDAYQRVYEREIPKA